MQYNEKYDTKRQIYRSNIQDRVFIAVIAMLMALIFGGLMSGCDSVRRANAIEKNNWPIWVEQNVRQGYVEPGMTKEQVKASWGNPIDVNKTVNQHSVTEQWVYGMSLTQYVYFENDTVTNVQSY